MGLREASLGLASAVNVYRRWEHWIYAGTAATLANAYGDIGKTVRHAANNLYANHDGNVYKASPGSGWQQHASEGWSPLANKRMRSVLDQWQSGRSLGPQRWGNFNGGFRP